MNRRTVLGGAGTLAVGLLGVSAASRRRGPAIVVSAARGEELLVIGVEDGTEIHLEYTHSVERTPVRDVYVVDGTGLVTDRTEFSSFGAGLPSEAGAERVGDRYVHYPAERRHETVSIAPGPVAGHELVVGDERYDLVELGGGERLTVAVERRLAHT